MGHSGSPGIVPVTEEEKDLINDARANGDGIAVREDSMSYDVTGPHGGQPIVHEEGGARIIYEVDQNENVSRAHLTVSGARLGSQHYQEDATITPGAEPHLRDIDSDVYHAYVKTDGSFASTTDTHVQAPVTTLPGGPPVAPGYTIDATVQDRIQIERPVTPGPK